MNTTMSTTALQSVLTLQKRAGSCAPGSDTERIIQIALDYCVNQYHRDGQVDYMVRDCLRNAKSTFYRSRKRGAAALELHTRHTCTVVVSDDSVDVVNPDSAEAVALEGNSELCRCALDSIAHHGLPATEFVLHLMQGLSVADAAARAGVSRATGYRWKSEIKQAFGSVFPGAGAVA
ncbi:hypothetical protein GS676_21285 [Rhodococcus hoagii]|nr:hypothetical protein [Prescottella equi]